MRLKQINQLKSRLMQAEKQNLQEALRVAKEQSSGPVTTAQLRAMGHPFSKKNPQPSPNPKIANKQSGELEAGWMQKGPSRVGNQSTGSVYNNTNHARLIAAAGNAKSTSVTRPITRGVADKVSGPREDKLRRSI